MKKAIVLVIHAFIGWALCAAVMMIGMTVTTIGTTLVLHAILAPIFFGVISLVYFKKFFYTTPLLTAVLFTGFVVTVDFFIVALLINRSLEMFTSMLGTWIPFSLIFLATFVTGLLVTRSRTKNN